MALCICVALDMCASGHLHNPRHLCGSVYLCGPGYVYDPYLRGSECLHSPVHMYGPGHVCGPKHGPGHLCGLGHICDPRHLCWPQHHVRERGSALSPLTAATWHSAPLKPKHMMPYLLQGVCPASLSPRSEGPLPSWKEGGPYSAHIARAATWLLSHPLGQHWPVPGSRVPHLLSSQHMHGNTFHHQLCSGLGIDRDDKDLSGIRPVMATRGGSNSLEPASPCSFPRRFSREPEGACNGSTGYSSSG